MGPYFASCLRKTLVRFHSPTVPKNNVSSLHVCVVLFILFFLTNNLLFMVDQNPRLHDKPNVRHQEVNVLWFHCSSQNDLRYGKIILLEINVMVCFQPGE